MPMRGWSRPAAQPRWRRIQPSRSLRATMPATSTTWSSSWISYSSRSRQATRPDVCARLRGHRAAMRSPSPYRWARCRAAVSVPEPKESRSWRIPLTGGGSPATGPYQQGAPWDGISDDEAYGHYQQISGRVPPDVYEDSARDAFERLTPARAAGRVRPVPPAAGQTAGHRREHAPGSRRRWLCLPHGTGPYDQPARPAAAGHPRPGFWAWVAVVPWAQVPRAPVRWAASARCSAAASSAAACWAAPSPRRSWAASRRWPCSA